MNLCPCSLSAAWSTTTPASTWSASYRAWPRDKKIIVQRGWAQFPALAEDGHIKVIGKVSHDQLFRHASAVIHHGGAGTTASALHAGKPQIVVPHIGDQNFFGANRTTRLWISPEEKNWPEQLHHALTRLAAQGAHAQSALTVQSKLLRKMVLTQQSRNSSALNAIPHQSRPSSRENFVGK
ncbi:MAG: glycosyltransferase [Nibricoccus sp.]